MSSGSNTHGDSPNAASQTIRSSCWKVEDRVCSTGQPRLEAHHPLHVCTSHLTQVIHVSSRLLAAVRSNRMWQWVCRSGRRVWLRSENGTFLFTPVSDVCRRLAPMNEALPLLIFRSAIRNAARSVLLPMGRTAAMAHAAIAHAWY